MRKLTCLLLISTSLSAAADYKAGLARMNITPDKAMYLSGYGNRTHASVGKIHDLWAKALAIEDPKGGRVVIVSSDLLGLPRAISDVVAARVLKQYGLDRARLMLNSSHTHTGPILRHNSLDQYDLPAADR